MRTPSSIQPIRRLLRTVGACCALGLLGLQPVAAQSLVLFDDFSAASINPNRWMGEEGKSRGAVRAEARRAISSQQLRLEAKAYGNNTQNVGTSLSRNSMVFAKSSAITAIKATVTMRTANAVACAGNANAGLARASLFGFFFNAGAPIHGTNMNDVFGGIQLYRASNSADPANVLRVQAFVGMCVDDTCSTSTTLASQDLGTTMLNAAVDLSMTWNQSSNNFVFQRGDTSQTATLAYSVSDALPAAFPVKRLEVSNVMAQCTAGRVGAYSVADFDNVMTNALPAQAASVPIHPVADSQGDLSAAGS